MHQLGATVLCLIGPWCDFTGKCQIHEFEVSVTGELAMNG